MRSTIENLMILLGLLLLVRTNVKTQYSFSLRALWVAPALVLPPAVQAAKAEGQKSLTGKQQPQPHDTTRVSRAIPLTGMCMAASSSTVQECLSWKLQCFSLCSLAESWKSDHWGNCQLAGALPCRRGSPLSHCYSGHNGVGLMWV